MKNIRSLKSIILAPYSLLLLLFAVSPIVGNAQGSMTIFKVPDLTGGTSPSSNASWVEYTYTKSIDSNGTMSKPSTIRTESFAFEGSYVYHIDSFKNKDRYVYHHSENGNSVYYIDICQGRSLGNISYSIALLVSADKKTINVIYNADSSNRSYAVYKKGVDRSIGEMYE